MISAYRWLKRRSYANGQRDMHYQTLRSVSDHHVFVVCRDGSFYDAVPADVRKQGPWAGPAPRRRFDLKPEYRRALARDGYALVKCELAVFNPEA